MKQKPRSSRQPGERSAQILVAVIGAIGLVLSAFVTVWLPIVAGRSSEPTSSASAPPAAPSSPSLAPSSPSLAPSSPSLAPTGPPADSVGFPCDATVSSWQANDLNVVRDFPTAGGQLRDTIQVGTPVRIVDVSGNAPPWYRIASPEGRVLGWIPAEYLTLSATCPHA